MIWKIIRIIALYVVSFIACVLLADVVLKPVSESLKAIFALFAPVAFVWWFEAGRNARFVRDEAPQPSPAFDVSSPYTRDKALGKRMPHTC